GRRRRHARGAELEAFDALGASVEFQLPPAGQRTLLVTSAVPGDGRAEVTARLGESLAETGHPPLLVDAPPRYGTLSEFFGVAAGPGLRGLLGAGTRGEKDVVTNALAEARVNERLWVLAGGERTASSSRSLGGDGAALETLFAELSRHAFDYVVV